MPISEFAQAGGETKGCFFASGEEIAQMRYGAASGLAKLLKGHFVGFDPAKHRVFFWF